MYVKLRHIGDESREQGAGNPCGPGGAKGRDQLESGRPKHVPHAGTVSRVTGGRADTAIHREESQGEAHCASAPCHAGELRATYDALKRDAAPGGDGVTWKEYGEGLAERLLDLHSLLHAGTYRATPSRRVNIPKLDGGTRPLGGGRTGRQDRPEGRCGQHPDAD